MKVFVNKEEKNYQSVWLKKEGHRIKMIDQRLLPHEFKIFSSHSYRQTAWAIRSMVVRGAPAIGATAAYAIAQAILEYEGTRFEISSYLKNVDGILRLTRPTAYNLFHALDFMTSSLEIKGRRIEEIKNKAFELSQEYAEKEIETCKAIGKHGKDLIKDGVGVLTHCNAGALACLDYGTALSPMRFAHYDGVSFEVYVDETRPRMQGSRLTAWELKNEGIDHQVIVDNAAGFFMQKGEIDLVIVGADRIAKNGDVINKIGTYEKALLAHENNIPFYVAAPKSTIDHSSKKGKEVEIEERSPKEVSTMYGMSDEGKDMRIQITPEHSRIRNPAFDVTPCKYVTGIITEEGIKSPDSL